MNGPGELMARGQACGQTQAGGHVRTGRRDGGGGPTLGMPLEPGSPFLHPCLLPIGSGCGQVSGASTEGGQGVGRAPLTVDEEEHVGGE